jgi:hypothetical protein
MFDTFHVGFFCRMNVRILAHNPNRLNGRLGLRQDNHDRTDGLPQHIVSASLAVAFRTPTHALDDIMHRSRDLEVCVYVAISHDWRSNRLQIPLLPHIKSFLPISFFEQLDGESSSGVTPEGP